MSAASDPGAATRAEVVATAIADTFRDDREILASPIGLLPGVGARLAKLTTSPQLLLSDGQAYGALDPWSKTPQVESWISYRTVFDIVASGARHVMMGANQIGRWGDQNLNAFGDPAKPSRQLLGMRGAPGNTVNHTTSYWIPRHSARVFVEPVDTVSGVGYRRAEAAGAAATRFHELRHVVTNLAVLDFETPDHAMRIRSVHPWSSLEEVVGQTGFELVVPADVPTSRVPTDEELQIIREVVDPRGTRDREVPPA
ncbi:MAG TPA: CoA-transferase [Mycobacteriales bacterium]|nr:CoA-transferase [Mycobacteriales bacterium]